MANAQAAQQETITEDGEIVEATANLPVLTDTTMAGALARAEIDAQVATARRFPRSVTQAVESILSLATLDQETAADSLYALPRGGKPIKGPSVRLAEIVQQCWGNNRVEAKVIAIDRANKIVTAEGTFHDLQTNSATRSVIQRRISGKDGRLYSDDMIIVTGNAACSIARRNAILAGVPKAIWRKAYDAAEKVVIGDIKTLAEGRETAVKAFAAFGVKPEQVFAALELKGYDDITIEHIPTLRAMYSALKNGEATVEEMFDPRRGGKAFEVVANPLANKGEGDKPKPAAKAEPAKAEPKADAQPKPKSEAKAQPEQPPAEQTKTEPEQTEQTERQSIQEGDPGDDAPASGGDDESWPTDKKPTNAGEYEAYLRSHFNAATDPDRLAAWFKSKAERDLRTACGVEIGAHDADLKERAGELRGAKGA